MKACTLSCKKGCMQRPLFGKYGFGCTSRSPFLRFSLLRLFFSLRRDKSGKRKVYFSLLNVSFSSCQVRQAEPMCTRSRGV